jgi:hypothetical protein
LRVEEVPDDSRWWAPPGEFRVRFWETISDDPASDPPMWSSSMVRVVGAEDVTEAIEWARMEAKGRPFTVFLEVERNPPGMVQVFGTDPTVE